MADKNGVVLVMFDLPNASKAEQRAYRHFHKYIISKGYCRIQKSIYVKLLRNIMNAKNEITDLKAMSPNSGNIAVVPMTLNNFKKMEFVLGKEFDFSVFSDKIVYFQLDICENM